MNEINLGSIKLPINAATKSFAILAKRGAGKTYLGGVMAEEFFKNNIPFVVFDPIDVWWGLRFDKNGKDKGLPVVVFGLEHADILLDRDMGPEIARAIVKENVSCVISTFGMPKVGARHLIAEFAETLLNINNTPRHVFIEEAHEYVPQRVVGGMSTVFSRVESLVTMGRNRGIGVTMLNQRAATLNKDVLTQIDTLLALRSLGPQDRKALAEWVEAHGTEDNKKFDDFIKALPSIPTGEGYIWSPEFLGVFDKFKIRKRETLHPDREKIGKDFEMPELTQTDVQSFISKFSSSHSSTAQKVKGQSKQIPQIIQPIVENETLIQVRNQYESQLIQKDGEIHRLNAIIENIRGLVGGTPQQTTYLPLSNDVVSMWKNKLGPSSLATRILNFLVENNHRAFSREQIALALGVSAKGGYINNEWGRLMRTSTVVKDGSMYKLNPNL